MKLGMSLMVRGVLMNQVSKEDWYEYFEGLLPLSIEAAYEGLREILCLDYSLGESTSSRYIGYLQQFPFEIETPTDIVIATLLFLKENNFSHLSGWAGQIWSLFRPYGLYFCLVEAQPVAALRN